ncbi:hypothetical protein BXZ70DRAFT_909090 [Cristinia sonorae]|uniref:Uncharacterized protein n=1 Tax=Cristinia sonorae TaxID=1940300 RepID=A0A8K0UIK9_9AGAR|nr:hypothetical protein BXZ70DRAFT_909090 [Cristinia sonorae]
MIIPVLVHEQDVDISTPPTYNALICISGPLPLGGNHRRAAYLCVKQDALAKLEKLDVKLSAADKAAKQLALAQAPIAKDRVTAQAAAMRKRVAELVAMEPLWVCEFFKIEGMPESLKISMSRNNYFTAVNSTPTKKMIETLWKVNKWERQGSSPNDRSCGSIYWRNNVTGAVIQESNNNKEVRMMLTTPDIVTLADDLLKCRGFQSRTLWESYGGVRVRINSTVEYRLPNSQIVKELLWEGLAQMKTITHFAPIPLKPEDFVVWLSRFSALEDHDFKVRRATALKQPLPKPPAGLEQHRGQLGTYSRMQVILTEGNDDINKFFPPDVLEQLDRTYIRILGPCFEQSHFIDPLSKHWNSCMAKYVVAVANVLKEAHFGTADITDSRLNTLLHRLHVVLCCNDRPQMPLLTEAFVQHLVQSLPELKSCLSPHLVPQRIFIIAWLDPTIPLFLQVPHHLRYSEAGVLKKAFTWTERLRDSESLAPAFKLFAFWVVTNLQFHVVAVTAGFTSLRSNDQQYLTWKTAKTADEVLKKIEVATEKAKSNCRVKISRPLHGILQDLHPTWHINGCRAGQDAELSSYLTCKAQWLNEKVVDRMHCGVVHLPLWELADMETRLYLVVLASSMALHEACSDAHSKNRPRRVQSILAYAIWRYAIHEQGDTFTWLNGPINGRVEKVHYNTVSKLPPTKDVVVSSKEDLSLHIYIIQFQFKMSCAVAETGKALRAKRDPPKNLLPGFWTSKDTLNLRQSAPFSPAEQKPCYEELAIGGFLKSYEVNKLEREQTKSLNFKSGGSIKLHLIWCCKYGRHGQLIGDQHPSEEIQIEVQSNVGCG